MKCISSKTALTVIGYLYVFTATRVVANKDFPLKSSHDQSIYNENDRFLEEVLSATSPAPDNEDGTKRYLFKFRTEEGMRKSQYALASNHRKSTVLMTMRAFNMEVVDIASEEELEELMADDDVIFAERDQKRYLLNPLPKETAKYLRRQQNSEVIPYGIDLVKALDVSDEFVEKMKVCIIDTGYDINHEDLPNGPNVGGNDNGRSNPWGEDGNGHGTHVAGTIAAIGGNDIGVAGVNRSGKVGLHIERFFGDNGRPIFGSELIGLASRCVEAGSNIISMSLGGPFRMESESEAFRQIYEEKNVLVVAAAGNSGNTAYSYPGSYSSVMSVAAIDKDSVIAYFSQQNDQVDISAPGVEVLSTKTGGGYVAYSGTSMACPHVAGVAALVWSHFTDKSSQEIRRALTATADDLGDVGRDDAYGYGLVRADRAFQLLNGDLTLSPTAAPTPQRPCLDAPEDFTDRWGNDCGWYENSIFFNRCRWFAESNINNDGVSAIEACCICDGGTFEPITQTQAPTDSPTETSAPSQSPTTSPPTSSPTTSPPTTTPTSFPTATATAAPTGCVDNVDWVDSRGSGCENYGIFKCWLFGNKRENDGLTANDACCLCQLI